MNAGGFIALIGISGAGKTTIGKLVSQMSGLQFYDTDDIVENASGMSIPELFAHGEARFREHETRALESLAGKRCVVACGGGIVTVKCNLELLKEHAICFFIQRPLSDILRDLDVSTRPLLSDGRNTLSSLYAERLSLYKSAADFTIVNASTPLSAAERIVSLAIY